MGISVYLRHFISVLIHKYFVFLAGLQTGAPLWRLFIHDWTKFTPAEFGRYARYSELRRLLKPGGGDGRLGKAAVVKIEEEFALAWLNHENRNPHHWGYWVPRSGAYTDMPRPMPEKYVREMVADLMGASRSYTGSWDMADWLAKNPPFFKLHKDTAFIIHVVLREVGYIHVGPGDWDYKYYKQLRGDR